MRPVVDESDVRRFLDETFAVCVEIPYVNGQFASIREWLVDKHGEDALREEPHFDEDTIQCLWTYYEEAAWSFVFTVGDTRVYFRDEKAAMHFKLLWGNGCR